MLIQGDFVHSPQLGNLEILKDQLLSIFLVNSLAMLRFQSPN
jgi:hypothetical protein